jgi:alcohol dehydrogenase (cytochrome c)
MEWNGPAYEHSGNTLYVATVDWCGVCTKTAEPPRFTVDALYYGGAVAPDPRDQAHGWLQAVDASTGKVRWKRQWPTPLIAGVTVTRGGLLFTGDLDDNLVAVDTKTGKTLYSFNTGGSVGGGVISYEVKGKQYVAALSGAVSGLFWRKRPRGGGDFCAAVVFPCGSAPRSNGLIRSGGRARPLCLRAQIPRRMGRIRG